MDDRDRPVKDAYIVVTRSGAGGASASYGLGKDGAFALGQLGPGTYSVCVQSPDGVYLDPCTWSTPRKVTLAARQVARKASERALGDLDSAALERIRSAPAGDTRPSRGRTIRRSRNRAPVASCRWPMAADGLASPQSWNRYGYVQNDPAHFTDSTGLMRDQCGGNEMENDPYCHMRRQQWIEMIGTRAIWTGEYWRYVPTTVLILAASQSPPVRSGCRLR